MLFNDKWAVCHDEYKLHTIDHVCKLISCTKHTFKYVSHLLIITVHGLNVDILFQVCTKLICFYLY